MTITKDIALKYHKAGFHVVPVGQDKRPLCKWKQYQIAQTAEDVQRLWQSPSWGIAAITGINGLECIDVDEKYDVNGDLFLRYQRMNDKYSDGSIAFPYLTVCSTMNGGYHIFYRCDAVQGNQKLAMRPATNEELQRHNEKAERKIDDPNRLPQVLIETRGEKVLITPTPGYNVEYGAMRSIPEITQEQRYNLLMNARRFDEVEVSASEIDIQAKKQAVQQGKAPWDDYNEKQDIVSLLESYGWSIVYEDSARVHMLRPGDSSTKTSGNYHKQHNLFRCHSTSTCLPLDKSLTATAIYAYYEHGGDFKQAARSLSVLGFGDKPSEKNSDIITVDDLIGSIDEQPEKQKQSDDLLAFVKGTKFDIRQPIKEEDAVLTSTIFGKQHKLAGKGMIAGVVGEQKSGKSLIVSCFVSAALSGKQKLTFDMDLQGGNGIYFDTEQPEFWYKKTQQRIYRMAGLYDNPSNYEAYMLRRLTVKQRIDVITQMLKGRKDLSMIVIDGIVDLCENFNDEGKSSETIENLMRWSDETGALIVTVLHITKSAGYLRGHLGTALQNKYDLGLQVQNDNERGVYSVKHRDSRFAPFPGFEFVRDERGVPVLDIDDTENDEDNEYPIIKTTAINKTANTDEDLPF